MFYLPATPTYFSDDEIEELVESQYPVVACYVDDRGHVCRTVNPDRDDFRRALYKQRELASPESRATHSPQPEPRKMANKQTPGQIQHAFSLAVSCERQKSPHITRQQAIARVAKRDPDLYATYQASLPTCGPKLHSKAGASLRQRMGIQQ